MRREHQIGRHLKCIKSKIKVGTIAELLEPVTAMAQYRVTKLKEQAQQRPPSCITELLKIPTYTLPAKQTNPTFPAIRIFSQLRMKIIE